MIQKNLSIALSYSGFILGCSLIVSSAFEQKALGIQNYTILVVLQILLAAIILPLFRYGLILVFRLQNESKNLEDVEDPNWGFGL